MKALRFLFILAISLVCYKAYAFAGPDTTTVSVRQQGEQHYYENVVTIPNALKGELYKKAKQWIVSSLKTADQNISYDEANLQIINTGAKTIDPKLNSASFVISEGYFDFKIQLNFKDGRYKIKIDNIEIYTMASTGYQKKTKTRSYTELEDNKEGRYIKAQIDQKLTEVVRSLNDALKSEKSEKDW